jgi:hypothetical protein
MEIDLVVGVQKMNRLTLAKREATIPVPDKAKALSVIYHPGPCWKR